MLTIKDSNRVSGQILVYLTFSFIGYIDFFGYTGPKILNPFIDFKFQIGKLVEYQAI
jgi:hypothetical protein